MAPRRTAMVLFAAAGLAGCAAPTLSRQDLASVSRQCGVPEELLSQDVGQRRFLILDPVNAARPAPEVACVNQWARRRHMRLIYIESIEENGN
jgi:hypothetical protein